MSSTSKTKAVGWMVAVTLVAGTTLSGCSDIYYDRRDTVSFAANDAVVNTRTGSVEGPGAIATQTAQGAVKSNAYDVYNKGDRVIFKGGVHARLNGH